MNIIAVDIGNTNITIALYLKDEEEFIKSVSGRSHAKLTELFKSAWEKIPVAQSSKEGKRDGVIVVCSVKPAWTKLVQEIVKDNLDEKLHIIGQDIPLPLTLWVDEPEKVGTDRVVSAAAAYAVVKDAVAVADFGTAVTIDLVDEKGIFLGGVICPGLDISARALKEHTAQLPEVKVTRPKIPYGKNTAEAIKSGLYYSAVATVQEVIRRYAEDLGKWPHTVLTGSAAKIIKDDCEFIDSYVPNLVIKGIVLTYKKYIEEKIEQVI
ncbi:MAG TPA: type III pantothenate kinase [Sedimentisphaerales bacterium]|nr:type III pantothenate kinase [Sedimentisphaerales bacterium]